MVASKEHSNDLERIRRYWEEAGESFPMGEAVTPTSRDPYLGRLEEANILSLLRGDQEVLEVGCGDASHTILYAKRVKRVIGLDVSKSLVKIARGREIVNAKFIVDSVLNLDEIFPFESFDCTISQRCLINLPSWKLQKSAILQVHNILRKGGIFILTEGFQEPLDKLNLARRRLGLSEIRVVDYNRNLPKSEFESSMRPYFEIVERKHYGLYLFLSRIFHPLIVHPSEPKHESAINKAAFHIALELEETSFEEYSYNLFYALKKVGNGDV